jgi:ligand-binding sensor domain-containing protein
MLNDNKLIRYPFALFFIFILGVSSKGQDKADPPAGSTPPGNITRNIIQDRKGNIWFAAFDGIFKYDGSSFSNITSKVSSSRFFSVAEDRKGNFWFGSIGEGVYKYDGKTFQNFTIKEGLVNNEVGCIYEDKAGNIWFGANGGASLYDGKTIRNFIMDGDLMKEDHTGKSFPMVRPPNEVNSIIEDKKGRLWFATRGNTFVYDGKTFVVFAHEGKPFKNVRTLMEDRDGNIWLGGNDGLWRYNGITCTNFTTKFVGYVYQDRKGNIWTSSEATKDWALSRYEGKSLTSMLSSKPVVTEVKSDERMIFGILEASDGTIWYGTLNGVSHYDGNTGINFKAK